MMNKKIIVLALVLLIIAGIVVVGLKGFNVDLMLAQHDSIEYTINEDFEVSDIENITKEVLGDKKFKVRVIELFGDAVSINTESFTNEEEENLVKKLDEKYKNVQEENQTAEGTEVTTETTENSGNYTKISNPKIRLSSLFKPYIVPSIIAGLVILCYEFFRYKKLGSVKIAIQLVSLVIISILSLLSIIAIVRFPFNIYVLPCILVIVLIELIIFNMQQEKKLSKIKNEEE